MKYIIIYEDDTRTLIFKSNSREKVDKWMEKTVNNIKELGGITNFSFPDVAFGILSDGESWKISIYNDYEIDNLKKIGF